ncbi:MAG: ATP-binding protein [Bacteroidales bacterium]|nr:ATP-binding protein [Bacteroidales bacterium]
MEINPFYVTNNIPEEYFCDRVAESEKLLKSIFNQENVVLYAQRRIGKTGLINHCFSDSRVKQEFYAISIDILHTGSLQEFVRELGNAVFKEVAGRSTKMLKTFGTFLKSLSGSFGFDPYNGTPTFNVKIGDISEPSYTLDEIFAYMESADKPCIVAIDEFQQITYYKDKRVEELLRGKIQRLQNTHFIFAGSERRLMGEMFNSSKRAFYRSASQQELGMIAEDVYVDFAVKHFELRGKHIDTDGVRNIYRKLDGVTMYVHKVLHDSFANTPSGGTCTSDDLQNALDSYLDENSHSLKQLLGSMSQSQKELLYSVCADSPATGITSAAFIKRHGLKSSSSVQAGAKVLLATNMITLSMNQYTVSDSLMKIWLIREGLVQ